MDSSSSRRANEDGNELMGRDDIEGEESHGTVEFIAPGEGVISECTCVMVCYMQVEECQCWILALVYVSLKLS